MKALILLSGGIDSTTCLAIAVEKYGRENVVALSTLYGQKHTKELKAARNIAEYYNVELLEIWQKYLHTAVVLCCPIQMKKYHTAVMQSN